MPNILKIHKALRHLPKDVSIFYVGNSIVGKVNKLTDYVQVLKKERIKRLEDFEAFSKQDRMDDGSFTIMRKKSSRLGYVVFITILFEIFLNYVSTLIFIQGDGLLFIIVRWGLAIILTLSAMLVTDVLLAKLLPEESVRIKGKNTEDDQAFYNQRSKAKRMISLIILPILLIAIEIAIVGVARARALDIEGGQSGGILYYGFILLSMALPIVAGYFKWDSEQHGKLYENTLSYHKSKKLLHVVELILVSNMKDVKNVVEKQSSKALKQFSKFKLFKENYNLKNSIAQEDISAHYCASQTTFNDEVLRKFGEDVNLILAELFAMDSQKTTQNISTT